LSSKWVEKITKFWKPVYFFDKVFGREDFANCGLRVYLLFHFTNATFQARGHFTINSFVLAMKNFHSRYSFGRFSVYEVSEKSPD
jgi:uncharacterized radical SAM superfamily Fe-S cluster-containing enzyme